MEEGCRRWGEAWAAGLAGLPAAVDGENGRVTGRRALGDCRGRWVNKRLDSAHWPCSSTSSSPPRLALPFLLLIPSIVPPSPVAHGCDASLLYYVFKSTPPSYVMDPYTFGGKYRLEEEIAIGGCGA